MHYCKLEFFYVHDIGAHHTRSSCSPDSSADTNEICCLSSSFFETCRSASLRVSCSNSDLTVKFFSKVCLGILQL